MDKDRIMAGLPLITLKDIHLTYGVSPLLQGAEFSVAEGERVCLVGRNGSGKSTLMKIAAGLIEADKGERFIHPGATVRYLPQSPDLAGYKTVLDYVQAGLAPGDEDYRAHYLLEHLGLSGEEDPGQLSGGEARRAALARTLAPNPDVLFLDEPTNHLDLPAIEWLEEELKSIRSALVLISHDRRFLMDLTRKTFWIDRGQTRELNKGFGAFEAWRDEIFELEQIEMDKLDRKIEREEHWVRYGVTARRKRNVRRMADLADLRQQRRDHRGPQGLAKMEATEAKDSGKRVSELTHVSKAYGDRFIVKDFSSRIAKGDRVGLIGPNGAGKTTLLNIIIGDLAPDQGEVKLGTNLEIASLDQKRAALKPGWTLAEALTQGGGDQVEVNGQVKHVRAYMKDFLFPPEQANTPVEVLSGGEKARVMLARALALPSNFLVLDEPTNDLDLETLDLLQDLICDYQGTVLIVSHDRDFLDRVCTSVIVAEGQGVWQDYAGGYSDMVAQRGIGVEARKAEKKEEKAKSANSSPNAPKKAQKRKMSYKDQFALENLPKEIDALDGKIAKLQDELADPSLFTAKPDRFAAASKALETAIRDKDDKEERWLELEALREEIDAENAS
ncbi:ABC-F family ATP-binding cassette domain-containing protein [Woodsholea maritima]|uniref:ABC-F family ATP-binding cassette domain-containing protein n=1 Tax=Woodsholea maritima TaxID=240237 RepID=UPI0003738992|nr:ATP-binding cassette domain-containing protein [Woodsholea maritima]